MKWFDPRGWFGRGTSPHDEPDDEPGNEPDDELRAVEELLDPHHDRASIVEGDRLTVAPGKVRERIAEVMERADNDIDTPVGPEDAVSFDELVAVMNLPGGPGMLVGHVVNTGAGIMLRRYPETLVRAALPAEFDLRTLHPHLVFDDDQHELARTIFNRRMAAAVDLEGGDLDAELDPLPPADQVQVFIATFFMFGTKVGALQAVSSPQRVDEHGQVEQDDDEVSPWRGPSYDPATGRFAFGHSLGDDPHKMHWQLHNPGVGLCHGLITGPERSGKTNAIRVLVAEALHSGRFALLLADPLGRNGLCETFGRLLPAGSTARSYGDTLELLAAAAAAIDARHDSQPASPDPTPDDPGLLLIIDDADAVLGNKRAATLARRITTRGATAHVALVVSTRSVNRRDFGGDTDLIRELALGNAVAYDEATARYLHSLTHPDGNGPGDPHQ